MRVLVTGGAGFIGSHIVETLVRQGHEPVVLDALLPSAHPYAPELPAGAEWIQADVRDAAAVGEALRGVDVVCHQAAMVGLGKDFADAPDYVSCNDLGTAILLAAMAEAGVRRLVLAGSMVVYGEGRYDCPRHGRVRAGSARRRRPGRRPVRAAAARGAARSWRPAWSDEDAPADPRNVYATTKLAQEHLGGRLGARRRTAAAVSLRYHNVYGPGMPRDTPYAGVASFFRSSLARGEAPRGLRGRRPAPGLRARTGRGARPTSLALDGRPDRAAGAAVSAPTTPAAGRRTRSARWPPRWPRRTAARPPW